MVNKGWPSSRRPFGWICRCTKKSIKQTNCGGCLDIAHICFVFFFFYSTIMIFTLADQLQWPTKQLTVLQIVSKKVLWMSSTFRCESSTPRYPHGDFWSWLLGLPGFFSSDSLSRKISIHYSRQALQSATKSWWCEKWEDAGCCNHSSSKSWLLWVTSCCKFQLQHFESSMTLCHIILEVVEMNESIYKKTSPATNQTKKKNNNNNSLPTHLPERKSPFSGANRLIIRLVDSGFQSRVHCARQNDSICCHFHVSNCKQKTSAVLASYTPVN